MQTIFGFVLAGLSLAVVGYWAVAVHRRGSFKGAAFDARILVTVGEALAHGRGSVHQKLVVHTLDRDGESLVGVEVRAEMDGMYPIVLTRIEADRLIGLLQQANREGAAGAV